MIVRGEAVDVLFERVVGMERLVGVKQSLRLDGKSLQHKNDWHIASRKQ